MKLLLMKTIFCQLIKKLIAFDTCEKVYETLLYALVKSKLF